MQECLLTFTDLILMFVYVLIQITASFCRESSQKSESVSNDKFITV